MNAKEQEFRGAFEAMRTALGPHGIAVDAPEIDGARVSLHFSGSVTAHATALKSAGVQGVRTAKGPRVVLGGHMSDVLPRVKQLTEAFAAK